LPACSVFQQEGELHRHAVLRDLAFGDARLLLDHVESSDAADRLARPREPFLDGGVEALGRGGGDLADPCDCHRILPWASRRRARSSFAAPAKLRPRTASLKASRK